jgi:uncharacterized protein YlxP (DUF503 family)
MVITFCQIHLYLPYIESLKGRRKVINSLKEKLKKLNISVADVSLEYAKEADLAIVFITATKALAQKYKDTIERLLERDFCEHEIELICEEL